MPGYERIAVYGAGAVGSVLGGYLAESGLEVTLIGRAGHVRAVNEHGLKIAGVRGARVIRVRAAETLDQEVDLVLLTVKSQDTAAAAAQLKLAPGAAPVVSLQNGVRNPELLAQTLGRERVLAGVVRFEAAFFQPGRVEHTGDGCLVLGEFFPENRANPDRLRTVQAVLGRAFPTYLSPNIQGALWTKLLLNLNNSVQALSGLSFAQTYTQPRFCALFLDSLREALAVAHKAGLRLEKVPGIPLLALRLLPRLPLALSARMLKRRAQAYDKTSALMASTLQSLKRGRPTEIDFLNGEIVRRGRALGLSTPVNQRIVALVHQVEATGRFLRPEEV